MVWEVVEWLAGGGGVLRSEVGGGEVGHKEVENGGVGKGMLQELVGREVVERWMDDSGWRPCRWRPRWRGGRRREAGWRR